MRKELDTVERGIERCVSYIVDGDGNSDAVRSKLVELEGRKRELQQALSAAVPAPELVNHPNIAELYRRKIAEVTKILADEQHRSEAFDLIRSLIERIEVSGGETRGEPGVMLYGALASILDFALTSDNKKAAAVGSGSCRVLLVAGAGNQRCLPRPTCRFPARRPPAASIKGMFL